MGEVIRHRPNGAYYCDGRECGYQLGAGRTGEFRGEWIVTCPDCGDGMYAGRPVFVRRGGADVTIYDAHLLAGAAAGAYQAAGHT